MAQTVQFTLQIVSNLTSAGHVQIINITTLSGIVFEGPSLHVLILTLIFFQLSLGMREGVNGLVSYPK